MRYFSACLCLMLAGCGSAEDGPANEENPGAGGDGVAVAGASGQQGSGGSAGQIAIGGGGSTGGTTGGAGSMGRGGAAGTGGSPGTGGAGKGGSAGSANAPDAAVTIRACANLPATGQWENISPMAFKDPSNMETLAVVVDPLEQIVYAAAGNKTNGGNSGTGVLKSTDCGATFTAVSTGTNSDKIKSGDPWALLIDPVHPQTIYINNGYGNDPTIYKSTNGGIDWTALSPHPTWKTNSFVQDIAMDPNDPQHIAVSFHNNCTSPYTPLCLSHSTDGGATWQLFNGPSQLGGWAEAATLTVLGPKSFLFASAGAWFTGDGGQTWSRVVSETFIGAYPGSTVIAPDGTVYLTGSGSVYASRSNPLGSVFTPLQGSPRASVIIHDGVSLIASNAWGSPQPNWSAPLDKTTTWTHMPSPAMSRGGNQLAYDAAHHIVYSANWGAGLWRIVTR